MHKFSCAKEMSEELKDFEKSRIVLFKGQDYIKEYTFLPTLLSELKTIHKGDTKHLVVVDVSQNEINKSIPEIMKIFEGCILQFTHTREEIYIIFENNIKVQILNYNTQKNPDSVRGLGCDHLVLLINKDRSNEFKKSAFFSLNIIPLFIHVDFSILLYHRHERYIDFEEGSLGICWNIENMSIEDFIKIE